MVNPAGMSGENRAAALLVDLGYKIVARNFQTKYGEVDIIAHSAQGLLIVEVKERRTARFGSAREAITQTKLHKMELAARQFVAESGWVGPVGLAAITIDGDGEPELTTGLSLS